MAIGTVVSLASFWAIHKAAHRPANGELTTLKRLDMKIIGTTQAIHLMRFGHK